MALHSRGAGKERRTRKEKGKERKCFFPLSFSNRQSTPTHLDLLLLRQQESARSANWARGVASIARAQAELGGAAASSSTTTTTEPPTREDEKTLVDFYSERASALAAGLGAPRKVASTALVFLRRFYAVHSSLEHDPKDAMLSAVYVAAKAEESYVSAERLAAAAGAGAAGGAQGLLRREPLMLQALEFDLLVYLPQRALEGFWADVGAARVEAKKERRRSGEENGKGKATSAAAALIGETLATAPAKTLAAARKASLGACDVLMRSDACLLFPPGQVALAAMRSGLKRAGVQGGLPREFLDRAVSRAATGHDKKTIDLLVSSLEESLKSLDALGAAAAVSPSPDAARSADARVRTARASLAAAQRAAAATADAGASEARAAKVAAKRAATAAREAELLGPAPALRTDEEVAAMKSKRRKSEVAAAGGGGE